METQGSPPPARKQMDKAEAFIWRDRLVEPQEQVLKCTDLGFTDRSLVALWSWQIASYLRVLVPRTGLSNKI